MMRVVALLAVILWQTGSVPEPPVAAPQYLRYERAVTVPASAGQACAVLDAEIFQHSAPSLADVRLFPAAATSSASGSSTHEIPYVITVSQSATDETQPAKVLNLGGGAGSKVVFDLVMPQRPYSDVVLDLAGHDFLATATVSGEPAPGAAAAERTALGSFTLFDLTAQHLSHNATLPLVESTFPYLHVDLTLAPAPGGHATAAQLGPAIVRGAQVPPSRTAQTVYTTVVSTADVKNSGRETRATLQVPARVPIERVEFLLAPGFHGNFSRDVRVTATPEPTGTRSTDATTAASAVAAGDSLQNGQPATESISGTIVRVHETEAGREIRTEQLGVPAILGSNLQSPAKIEVALENGDDQPLPIRAVELQMRQRKLCFDAGAATAAGVALFYGDPALQAAVYDYQRLFRPQADPLVATLGPEVLNATFRPRPAAPRSFTERHPETLWVALIVVICVLGTVALKSARSIAR